MKKLAKVFAVVMVCVLAVTALAACGGGNATPNLDYDTVIANLKKAGYTVDNAKDDEVKSSDAASSVANTMAIEKSDITAFVSANLPKTDKNAAPDVIKMVWAKDEAAAKAAAEILEVSMQSAKEILEHNKSQMSADEYKAAKTYYDNLRVGYQGNVLWLGTVDAINATK